MLWVQLIIQQRQHGHPTRHCLLGASMGTMRLQRRRHAPISGRLRAPAARVVRLGYDPGLATRNLIPSTLAASSRYTTPLCCISLISLSEVSPHTVCLWYPSSSFIIFVSSFFVDPPSIDVVARTTFTQTISSHYYPFLSRYPPSLFYSCVRLCVVSLSVIA